MARRRRRPAMIVEIIVLAAVLALVNLLSLKFFVRADLSEGRVFSVSGSTRQVLEDLDDIVHIKVYFSEDLPPYMNALRREVRDMLGEYRAYAGKNLIIDFEDPAADPETERSVRSLGIPQVQMNIIEKDKAEVVNGYLGMAILYEDRSEIIPVVAGAANLEYDLTSAIIKVSMAETKTVGFLAAGEERNLGELYETSMASLRTQYEVRDVATSDSSLIPDDVNTLIVAGPRQLAAWDAYAIDQFIMRGGRALFLVDQLDIVQGSLTAVRVRSGVDSLLMGYGVEVRPDLVVDRSCGTASFVSRNMRFTLPYFLWPRVTKTGLDEVSPITNQLERLVLMWTSSIALRQPAGGPVEVTVLAASSEQSWSEEERFNLDPQQRFLPMTDTGPRNLAVLLEGVFQSHFAGKEIPQAAAADRSMDRSLETQIAVVGNSRFIEQAHLAQYPENQTFLLNLVDWLTLGESLIGIRSRSVTSRPIADVGEGAKATIRFLATFGVPLAVIIWGLARRYVKSRRRVRK